MLVTFGPWSARLRHPDHLPDAERRRLHGHVAMEGPPAVVAGEPVDLAFHFTAGEGGLGTGAQFGLAWRLPGDWGDPQWERPGEPNHFSADGAGLAFSHRAGPAPWNHLLTLTLDRPLAPGGRLCLVCRGWEAQTAAHPAHPFLCMMRSDAQADWVRLVGEAAIEVMGGAPHSWALACPSQCVAGEPFRFTVRCMDVWGNPSRGAPEPEVSAPGLTLLSLDRLGWGDVWRGTGRLAKPGLVRLRVEGAAGPHGAGAGVTPPRVPGAEGNPLLCLAEAPSEAIFWGDMHSGQCDLGCGQGSLDRYFSYAREVAGLDFTSHQANDVYVKKEDWEHTMRVTEAHHRPGQFLPFLGCEWTADPARGGDRNVFYRHDQTTLYRARRWYEPATDEWPEAPLPPDLYQRLEGAEALINLHVGGFTSSLEWHDPRLERLIEVHSTHATSRWFVADALARGFRPAITGGTDGVSGRPGADHPGRRQARNLRGGLTAVWAPAPDRDSVWQALKEGRCYATTGERIRLQVRREGKELAVAAAGTAAIEAILLRRGAGVAAVRPVAPLHPQLLRLTWWGSRRKGTTRDQRLDWDGTLTADAPLRVISPFGFVDPVDALTAPSAEKVAWRNATAGNRAGFLFESSGTRFACESPVHRFACGPEGYAAVDLPGLVDAGIRLGRAPDPDGPREAVARFRLDGNGPYWIEVLQVDGESAFWGVIKP